MSNFENKDQESEFYISNNNVINEAHEKVNTNSIKHKKRGSIGRVFSLAALSLVMALTGGILGGVVTYNVISSKNEGESANTQTASPVNFVSETSELTVADAYNKVKPAVVTITASGKVSYSRFYSQDVEGIGSGFIINEEGNVLTNYHVIELALAANGGTNTVTVSLSDGQEVSADIVNYDSGRDIAMLKLEEGTVVPGVAELGDSDSLYVGQEVIAIGTPLGTDFAQTCTKGIVSGVNRSLESEEGSTGTYIQTDAAINSGNSGGPLINSQGQVIGINTAKLSSSAGSSNASIEGMGFAIPINDASDRIESLSKKVLTVGITAISIDKNTANKNNIPEGVGIVSVTKGSPAEKAGIKENDIILEFDGNKVSTVEEINEIKATKQEGDKVKVLIDRNGQEITLTLEF